MINSKNKPIKPKINPQEDRKHEKNHEIHEHLHQTPSWIYSCHFEESSQTETYWGYECIMGYLFIYFFVKSTETNSN
jgi:hypothetical protein